MARLTHPRAFLIAETSVSSVGLGEALAHIGAADWRTDAPDAASLLTEFAGKLCYMSFDKSLNNNLTRTGGRDNHDYIQAGIVANGHGSVLEHSSVTFLLADVSRVVTHEVVRHRAGTAFSQTSGRYVRTSDISVYVPKDIAANPEAAKHYLEAMSHAKKAALELGDALQVDKQDFATKKRMTSAIRRVLPNGQSNNIVLTANHRAWRHMIEMRTSPHAEEEIRVVFAEISQILRHRFPNIYADAVVTEEDGIEVTTFKVPKV